LLHELGAEGYAEALAEHRRVVRDACAGQGGVEVDTQGDAFFVAFPTAPGALAAAGEILQGLAGGPIRLRMGLHTGTPHVGEEGYVGVDVHRAARIAASGHGGQVLVSASTAALFDPDGLRDLGEHRLKDLSAPERIYQLGAGDFPALKTLYRTNLPVPATPFLGREPELAEVAALLEAPRRLLTLTGPGGTGKTRLGLQAVAEVAEGYPDGVFWVPLAPLRDPELVHEAAADAVGARDGLAEHVADKRLLLMLDNFEHVVEAAAGLAGLLASCPNLRLVVTSRELLRVPGEQAYPVPPLEPGDGADLFLARARAVRPDFAPTAAVAELCGRLDNLPLALELAAARVGVLSPEQLLERLAQRLDLLKAGRGADPRQQTLRATIEWSHALLDEDEQRLFARLAVFRGGCTLEAAEQVCDADLDTFESLVDKSLVRVREGDRFWMLETIREYAAERLGASGEVKDVRRRHADWMLALAEEAQPHLRLDELDWIERLQSEHDNLRAALDELEASGETQLALRLAAAVTRFWYLKSHLSEGRRRLENALEGDQRRTPTRARALNGAAVMALNLGDPHTALAHAQAALELSQELGDAWEAAYSRMMVGNALAEGEDVAEAQPIIAQAMKEFRKLGDTQYALVSSVNLAWITGELGDVAAERTLHEQNLRVARAQGSHRIEAGELAQLAMIARDECRLDEAVTMLREAIRIEHSLGSVLEVANDLGRLSSVLAQTGDAEIAARLLSSSEQLFAGLGGDAFWWAERRDKETLTSLRGLLDEDSLSEAMAAGRALTLEEAVELALAELG
jgi:predicted ATPase